MLTVLTGDLLADRIGGPDPTVVALHGWGRSGADFVDLLAGHDALAIHLPGFGHSAAPPEPWGSPEYAAHVAAALAGRGPVVLVGHSFGGRVAVRLAAAHPELVAGLVLTGVPLVRATAAPRPSWRLRLAKRLVARRLAPAALVERIRRSSGSADYRAAEGVMRSVLVRVVGEDYREDLAAVAALDVPVRMVWGEADDAAPLAGARLAADLMPGAVLEVVPGAGHLLQGRLATKVRAVVDDVVAEVTR